MVCKSENKVNLLQYSNLYDDANISLLPINSDLSNRFKIVGGFKYPPSQFLAYQPLIQMNVVGEADRDKLVDRIMSLVGLVVNKLVYVYFKYAVTGLLVMPNNLLIHSETGDIKFDHFFSGLLLNMAAINNK